MTEDTTTPSIETPLISHLIERSCPSLSERSTLTYAWGQQPETGGWLLRIVKNSGQGMFCKDWIEASAIEAVVLTESELTSKSLQRLQPGKSINTAGFVLAALKDMGYVRVTEANTRLHEHVPGQSLDKLLKTLAAGHVPVKAATKSRSTAR